MIHSVIISEFGEKDVAGDDFTAIDRSPKLLGHSSVSTTQGYLNLDLDLETTASDFIPLAE